MIYSIECGQTNWGPLCFRVVMADGKEIRFQIYSHEVMIKSMSGCFRSTYTYRTQPQIIAILAARKLSEALDISQLPTEASALLEAAL